MAGPAQTLGLTVFLTCLGSSFLIGYHLAIINLPSDNIKKFLNASFGLTDETTTVAYAQVSSVFVIAAAMGAFSCGFLADGLGRRNSLIMNNVIGIIGAVVCCLTLLPKAGCILLYVGRFICGLNSGITIGVASLYLTEIAPQNRRGIIGACAQLAVTIGICISNCVTLSHFMNKENLWPLAIGLGAIPPAISLILLPSCPESARYLFLVKHAEEEAKVAYSRINGEDEVSAFMAEMKKEETEARSQPVFKFFQLFTQPDLRRPTTIAVLVQVLQQLSGINAVMANSNLMFKGAGVQENSIQYCVIGIGLLNVACTVVALPLLERLGRRTLLIWPTFVLAITLLLCTITVKMVETNESMKFAFSTATVALIYLYVICFAVGLGPIPALIVGEIFRQGPRTAAYSLSQGVQWLCNLMVLMSFPTLEAKLKGFVYLPFLAVVIVCWIYFFQFMPETKNRSYDEVARDLAGGSAPPSAAHHAEDA